MSDLAPERRILAVTSVMYLQTPKISKSLVTFATWVNAEDVNLAHIVSKACNFSVPFHFFIYHLMSLGSTGDQQTIKA